MDLKNYRKRNPSQSWIGNLSDEPGLQSPPIDPIMLLSGLAASGMMSGMRTPVMKDFRGLVGDLANLPLESSEYGLKQYFQDLPLRLRMLGKTESEKDLLTNQSLMQGISKTGREPEMNLIKRMLHQKRTERFLNSFLNKKGQNGL